jgi:tetratricopeptide (TPR) repeat protein
MATIERPGSWTSWYFAVALAWLLAATPCAAQETSAFAAATTAFETGDYRRALRLFETARANGSDSAALHYNIGVCQYRVGDYTEAAATFALVRDRFPQFAAVAEYNRGLALSALNDRNAARTAFQRARAGDDALAGLADSALARLGAANAPRSRWVGYFDVAAGHDDNVALVDELSLPATVSASTSFTELVGYAGGRVGQRGSLSFSGYSVRYADASQFDQTALRVDTAFGWSPGDWRFEAGPHFAETLLDGDGFERALGVSLRAIRPITERVTFDVRLVYDDLDAPSSRFAFIDGTRQRLRLGLESRGQQSRIRVGYEIEANDRASASVSPDRDRLVLNLQRGAGRWSLEATLAYRQSDYDDLAAPRHERLTEIGAAARRNLQKGWLFGTEYRLADNDSNIAQFGYRSRRVSLSVGKGF